MKQNFKATAKMLVILSISAILTSCSSLGGFNEILGIDATDATTNDPLKKPSNSDLPPPQGAAVQVGEVRVSQANNITTSGKIIPPKVTSTGIKTPIYVSTRKPTAKKPIKVAAKPIKKPMVKAKPKPTPVKKPAMVANTNTKISPTDYKYVDLFRFRSDMKAGKLENPLATAANIANNKTNKCKLEARKFTCFVKSLDRDAYIMVTP